MRLTKRDGGGNAVMDCDNCEIKYRESCCSLYRCRNALIAKLAAYEDTGLTPETIKNWMLTQDLIDSGITPAIIGTPLKHLFELAKAEAEGRLVILPCKVGDTVYRICPKCNTSHNGSCANCAWQGTGGIGGCKVFGMWGDGSYPPDKCTIVPWEACWNNMETIMYYINKRIFLTRAEAEAALMKGEKKNV